MYGILLVNLGTPDTPEPKAVAKYLRQFLSDPLVIDINPVARYLLVNLIIAPFRSKKSAEAYKKIWTSEGSPFLKKSQNLLEKVRNRYSEKDFAIELGMRYGNPSIESAIDRLLSFPIQRLIVLPLYPQYALSSTQSSIDEVNRILQVKNVKLPVDIIGAFYDEARFINAFAQLGRSHIEKFRPDHILFSFHGLPERHVHKTDPAGNHCLANSNCCDQITEKNSNCYRAQSFMTARLIAGLLKLDSDNYSITFQSRLGRTPWIKPYTDVVLDELASKGKKRILVFCPAFVADCLETLEEISMRAREQFVGKGGDDLLLVPSLNDSPLWVDSVCGMINEVIQSQFKQQISV